MLKLTRADWLRYGVAVLCAMLTILLRVLLDRFVTPYEAPFLLAFVPVVISAWYGGCGPGVLATVLSAIGVDFIAIEPLHTLFDQSLAANLRLFLFVLEGTLISVLGGMHRQSELRKAAILASATDGIITVDQDRTILEFNVAAERMFGCQRADVVGRNLVKLIVPPSPNNDAFERLWCSAASGKSVHPGHRVEMPVLHADGTEFPVELTIARIPSENLLLFTCFIRDISMRKQIEHRLAMQTRDLLEAKDAAERANSAKSEFLAEVSHELRTPMNAILGMLQLALREELTIGVRDYLTTAKSSAETLLFLLNDVLDLSRMEAGRFELESAPFSLRETLDETMKTVSLRAHEKGLELACHVHADVPDLLVGDCRRVRQVLMNLTINAIKFTEQGEIVVEVAFQPVEAHARDGHARETGDGATSSTDTAAFRRWNGMREEEVMDEVCLKFTVSDTGIGIAPEDQEKIFAPFTQLGTSSMHGSAGLGLKICRELIELMDGRIWVESQVGTGSRFHCTAVFGVTSSELVASPVQLSAVKALRDVPILVVDDNKTNRRILEDVLTNWSLRPTVVGDGETALLLLRDAIANDRRFALVLVDALMPAMDGFTFIQRMQQELKLTTATILMLSAADRQLFADRCQELEIAAYLEKPVSQSDLYDEMMTVLKGPQRERIEEDRLSTAARRLRVLVAEDTPANQKVVKAVLSSRGHTVQLAHNGREAVELIKQQEFDVVLMDVQMPTMDGLQATASIRNLDATEKAQIPIAALTAHAMRGDRERCASAGMDAYISKPIDVEKLIRVVEKLGARSLRSRAAMSTDGSGRENSRTQIPLQISDTDLPLLPSTDSRESRVVAPRQALPTASILNREAALQRLGGNERLFQNMVRYFYEDTPSLIEAIRLGIQTGNVEEIVRAAHTLKGLAANFNAAPAMTAAMRLERLHESPFIERDREQAALHDLESEISRLRSALAVEPPNR